MSLIERGADVNTVNKWNESPLTKAAYRGFFDIVKILIENGADVNLKTKNGHTALTLAAYQGHTNIVKVLIENGARINSATNLKDTALTLAAYQGHIDIVKMLIFNGASIGRANKEGNTALALAAKNGHHEIVEMLTPRFYGLSDTNKKAVKGQFAKLTIRKGIVSISDPNFAIYVDGYSLLEWNRKYIELKRFPSTGLGTTSLAKPEICYILLDASHKIRIDVSGKQYINRYTITKSIVAEEYISVSNYYIKKPFSIEFTPQVGHEYELIIWVSSRSISMRLIEKGKNGEKTIAKSVGQLAPW